VFLSAAIEGIVDQAVVEKLGTDLGFSIYGFYGLRGKPYLKQRMSA